jgi:DNA processing protein
VVVEAGARSGSLNTAGHAAAIGRPLGAVPGPVTSPASAGCHRLIREYDAVCVTTAEEMAELAGLLPEAEREKRASPGAASRGEPAGDDLRILDALSSRTGRTASEIATRSGMSMREVISRLGRLELEGPVTEASDGWRTRSRRPRPSSG